MALDIFYLFSSVQSQSILPVYNLYFLGGSHKREMLKTDVKALYHVSQGFVESIFSSIDYTTHLNKMDQIIL